MRRLFHNVCGVCFVIVVLAYLGENLTLQVALRAGGLYLDSLRAATPSQTVAASNQISESVSCFDVTSFRVIHCIHGGMNYAGFYRFL